MKQIDYRKIEELVREAGQIIRNADLSEEAIHEKGGAVNFCTDYDIEVQRFLIGHLKEVLPEAAYFGEEDTENNEKREDAADYVFYIDPIDGTTNFMFHYYHSCVSVGLAYKGTIIAGFVYNPYTDEMYVGIKGQGTTVNGKKMVLKDSALEEGLAGFDCIRYNEGLTDAIDILFTVVKELYARCLAVREGGSAALGLCRVASASHVAYVQMVLQPYDYAAASIIVEEAGGIMTQLDGSPVSLNHSCGVVCGTKKAWKQTMEIVQESIKKIRG